MTSTTILDGCLKNINRRLRRYALLSGFAACLLSFPGYSDERWQDSYCVEAQQVLAGTELVAELEVHENWDTFVESKASDSPLTVHEYLSNPSAEGIPRTLSCKMRTAERINATETVDPAKPAATGDTDCVAVHRDMVAKLLVSLAGQRLAVERGDIVFDEDETTYIGPRWLKPWPYDAVTMQGEVLHLRARALYAPHAWWIPMPERFKGNYYCHLVAPDYLEAILLGKVTPPLN